MIVVSGVMAGAAWTISTYADWTGSEFSVKKIAVLALSICASGALFIILTRILKIEEAGFLLNLIRRKMPGGKKTE